MFMCLCLCVCAYVGGGVCVYGICVRILCHVYASDCVGVYTFAFVCALKWVFVSVGK